MTEDKLIFKASMGAYIGDGWVPIVNDWYKKAIKVDPDLIVDQVKEKFGGIRIYFESPEYDEIDKLVSEAEFFCYETCEYCGSTEGVETRADKDKYWIKTMCGVCRGGN